MADELSDFQRGLKEGARDARLDEAFVRLNKINGSIERHAKSNEALTQAMNVGFDKLATEMRQMQEEARARELAVKVAAETLATETERRRAEEERLREERAEALQAPARTWGLRASKASVIYGLVAFVLGIYTVYGIFHPGR
jgi:hypothetical protein